MTRSKELRRIEAALTSLNFDGPWRNASCESGS